jgi:hypothetical protein
VIAEFALGGVAGRRWRHVTVRIAAQSSRVSIDADAIEWQCATRVFCGRSGRLGAKAKALTPCSTLSCKMVRPSHMRWINEWQI